MARHAKKAAPSKLAISLGGDWVYWSLTEQGTRRVSFDELPDDGPLLRASSQDVVVSPGTARGKRLRSRILNDVRAEFASFRQNGLIYATALEHVQQGMERVVPLNVVIDAVRIDKDLRLPGVVGVLIGEGDDALALAFAIRSTGVINAPLVVAGHGPGDQQHAAEQALTDAGITEDPTDSVWIGSAELYSYCQTTRTASYPLPGEILGIPKAQWAQGAMVLAAVFAAFGGFKYWQASTTRSSLLTDKQRMVSMKHVKPQIRELIADHVEPLVSLTSVDFPNALDDARLIQNAHTTISLELHKRAVTLHRPRGAPSGKITLKVDQSGRDNLPAIPGLSTEQTQPWPNRDGLENALSAKAPDGWSVSAINSNSSGTIVRVTYEQGL